MPSLDALARLAATGAIDLVGTVTQPDRPGNRGTLTVPAVKSRALELGLAVLQPARLRGDGLAAVIALRPELLVWAAYGNLIPRALLEAASAGALNVHASLLPRWRGAAPIAHAILAGDEETGISLMVGVVELDAGPVVAVARTPIGPAEDAGALTERLAVLGGELLERELPRYLAGTAIPVPQDPALVTFAPKLESRHGILDWSAPADVLACRVRAMTPEPGAFTLLRGVRLGVVTVSVVGGFPKEHGTVELRAGVPHVAAGAGWLRLDIVRPAGKRPMAGAEWARGARDLDGAVLGS